MIFGKRQQPKPTIVNRQDVPTLNDKNAFTSDKNNDGIPDYLQRASLPSLIKEIKDTTLAHIDTQKELENLKMRWRGYEYNPTEGKFTPACPPMINENGIMELSSILDPLATKHTMNANISEDWAHEQCCAISTVIARLVRDKRNIFQINRSNRDSIVQTVDIFMYNVFSRAISDGERDHTDKRLSLSGQNNPNPQPGGI